MIDDVTCSSGIKLALVWSNETSFADVCDKGRKKQDTGIFDEGNVFDVFFLARVQTDLILKQIKGQLLKPFLLSARFWYFAFGILMRKK